MNSLSRLALCFLLLLAAPTFVHAEDKPLEPLEPIKQKDASTLILPAEDYQLIPDPDGGLLLLCGDRLAWLADDGVTLLREQKLPRHYIDLMPRKDYFIAIGRGNGVVESLDPKTLKTISTVRLNTKRLYRIVPHPRLPVSYITTTENDMPFIMLDEQSGEMRDDPLWRANDIIIDPTGSFMLTRYSTLKQAGERLILNGPNILTTPRYESFNAVVRYHLDKSGEPVIADYRDGLTGGVTGIAASADARRVTVLSESGNAGNSLPGWDALDFKKLATAYDVNEGGNTASLDYHPMLSMVASAGKGGAVFLNADTGQPMESRLAKPNELPADTTFDKLHFSPDGKNALLLYKVGEVPEGQAKEGQAEDTKPVTRVLIAAPLKLSQAERARVARGLAEPKPVELPGPSPDRDVQAEGDTVYARTHNTTRKWIMENSIFGPESELSSDVIQQTSKLLLDEEMGFWMFLGPGLLKSGKATVVGVHQGLFMQQELTDEQTKASGLGRMSLVIRPGEAFEEKVPPRRVLSIPAYKVVTTKDGQLEGKMIVQKIGKIDRALFAATFTYFEGETMKRYVQHLGDFMEGEQNELSFKFNNPAAESDEPKLIVGFLQMEAFEISRRTDRRIPLSEPVLMITVHQPKQAKE